ncbi:hypothetical protein LZ30DRAFT_343603 [Colletotrichum cereale]|nr:hypothetical protein LZ30DRAFT_343603 [Colletotrichum cereale]
MFYKDADQGLERFCALVDPEMHSEVRFSGACEAFGTKHQKETRTHLLDAFCCRFFSANLFPAETYQLGSSSPARVSMYDSTYVDMSGPWNTNCAGCFGELRNETINSLASHACLEAGPATAATESLPGGLKGAALRPSSPRHWAALPAPRAILLRDLGQGQLQDGLSRLPNVETQKHCSPFPE